MTGSKPTVDFEARLRADAESWDPGIGDLGSGALGAGGGVAERLQFRPRKRRRFLGLWLVAAAALVVGAVSIGVAANESPVTEEPTWNFDALALAPYERELTALEEDAEAIAETLFEGVPGSIRTWFAD